MTKYKYDETGSVKYYDATNNYWVVDDDSAVLADAYVSIIEDTGEEDLASTRQTYFDDCVDWYPDADFAEYDAHVNGMKAQRAREVA